MNSRLWSSLLGSITTIIAFPVLAGNSSGDYLFKVERVGDNCQNLGEAYQAIGTFETANFLVNLCTIGDQYFYLGTAKNKSFQSNFIPAYPTEQLHTYQADNGNDSYIVKLQPTQATLIIQRNGKTIVVETALAQNCPQVSYDPKVAIAQELNYGSESSLLIGDRYNLNSNPIYTSQINFIDQLKVTDIPQLPLFNSVAKQPPSLFNCF